MKKLEKLIGVFALQNQFLVTTSNQDFIFLEENHLIIIVV